MINCLRSIGYTASRRARHKKYNLIWSCAMRGLLRGLFFHCLGVNDWPCGWENDAGLSNDAARLMFSCRVNRLQGIVSAVSQGWLRFRLISNVESEAWYQDADGEQSGNTELDVKSDVDVRDCVILTFAVSRVCLFVCYLGCNSTNRKNVFLNTSSSNNVTWGHIMITPC